MSYKLSLSANDAENYTAATTDREYTFGASVAPVLLGFAFVASGSSATASETESSIPRYVESCPEGHDNDHGSYSDIYTDAAANKDILTNLSGLEKGWDGYSAPPVTDLSLEISRRVIAAFEREGIAVLAAMPSVVGGIAIELDIERDGGAIIIECYNDGVICALIEDYDSEPHVMTVRPEASSIRNLVTYVIESAW